MAVITIFAFVLLTTFASILLTTSSSCDAPRALGLFCQDSASPSFNVSFLYLVFYSFIWFRNIISL